MTRVAVAVALAVMLAVTLGGCEFSGDVAQGHYTCTPSAPACPTGQACTAGTCQDVGAGFDAASTLDSCEAPAPATSQTESYAGVTTGHANSVDATCGGVEMSGADVVYVTTFEPGTHLTLTFTASRGFTASAYVVTSCTDQICYGDEYATPTAPIELTLISSPQYIVVDSTSATASGSYDLQILDDLGSGT